jgi:hypothetical protein
VIGREGVSRCGRKGKREVSLYTHTQHDNRETERERETKRDKRERERAVSSQMVVHEYFLHT